MKQHSATLPSDLDGATFRSHRERLKATQAELAAALDVHRVTVTRWETDVEKVPAAIARLLERMTPADIQSFRRKAKGGR